VTILDQAGRESLLFQMAPEIQTRAPAAVTPPLTKEALQTEQPVVPAEAAAVTTTQAPPPETTPTPPPAAPPPAAPEEDRWSRQKNTVALVASIGATTAATYALLRMLVGDPSN